MKEKERKIQDKKRMFLWIKINFLTENESNNTFILFSPTLETLMLTILGKNIVF